MCEIWFKVDNKDTITNLITSGVLIVDFEKVSICLDLNTEKSCTFFKILKSLILDYFQ